MSPDLVVPIVLLLLLAGSACVSSSETALFSLRPEQVHVLTRNGGTLGARVTWLIERPQRMLLAILLANNLVNISYFALAGWWAGQQSGWLGWIIPGAALCVLIVCGEILPKILASGHPELFTRLLTGPLYHGTKACDPLARLLSQIFPALDEAQEASSASIGNEEIKLVIAESRRHGVVSELAHDRLLEIVDLSSTPVWHVMTHRVDCPIIDPETDASEAREALRQHEQPYVLVVDPEQNEDCIGILTAQDLLKGGKPGKRMRKPLYIPEGALLPQAIALFQSEGTTFGVVVDEYGGTAGLLTLAHIGNALLGAGRSEDLPEIEPAEQLDEHTWRISGQSPMDTWETLLPDTDTSDCATIGGFVIRCLGTLPEPGNSILVHNLHFTVERVEQHRIASLRVRRLPLAEARRYTAAQVVQR